MHIGKRIVKLRKLRNYSQEKLGKGIISASHLSNIETGRFTPSEEILSAFAKVLEVPEYYLMNFNEFDESLASLLSNYRKAILLVPDSAEEIRVQIKENYPFICSIDQEVYFCLCESSYFLKMNQQEKANQFYNDEVFPFLKNIDLWLLSKGLSELYFYFQGGRSLAQYEYADSIYYFQKQLSFLDNDIMKAAIQYNLTLILQKLDHTEKAIYYGQIALGIYLKNNEWREIVKAYNLLGVLYIEDKTYPFAKDCLVKGLEIADNYQFMYLKQRIYHNFGVLYKNVKAFRKSEDFYYKALELKGVSSAKDITHTYRSLTDLFIQMERYEDAWEISLLGFQESADLVQTNQLKLLRARLNLHYGNEELYEKETREAIQYLYDQNQWQILKYEGLYYGDYLYSKRRYREAADYYKLDARVRENLDGGDYREKAFVDSDDSVNDSGFLFKW